MKKLIGLLAILFFAFSINMLAQEKADYSNDPGYVDFGNLSGFLKSNDVTEVNIESYLLRMVSNATQKNDPELSELLKGLKLVKVYSFKVDGNDHKEISAKINQLDNSLSSKNWNRIVKVKSNKENTNIYIKTTPDQNNIVGLVVASLDKKGEAAFVNIVGKIDLDAIGRLGQKFDIPSLNDVKRNKEEK